MAITISDTSAIKSVATSHSSWYCIMGLVKGQETHCTVESTGNCGVISKDICNNPEPSG